MDTGKQLGEKQTHAGVELTPTRPRRSRPLSSRRVLTALTQITSGSPVTTPNTVIVSHIHGWGERAPERPTISAPATQLPAAEAGFQPRQAGRRAPILTTVVSS